MKLVKWSLIRLFGATTANRSQNVLELTKQLIVEFVGQLYSSTQMTLLHVKAWKHVMQKDPRTIKRTWTQVGTTKSIKLLKEQKNVIGP